MDGGSDYEGGAGDTPTGTEPGKFKKMLQDYALIIFVVAVILLLGVIALVAANAMGYAQVKFGQAATGASFVSHMSPGWGQSSWQYGTDDAGSALSDGNKRLGISNMTVNPVRGASHFHPHTGAVRYPAVPVEHYRRPPVHSRFQENMSVSQVPPNCNEPWDDAATEEAKALAGVGSYRTAGSGMHLFNKAINNNIQLSDSQLEAIMQGGEPFVSHMTPEQIATLTPQYRQQVAGGVRPMHV